MRRCRSPKTAWSRRTGTGFTVIELMLVVLIVAILAAVALPTYQGQIRKSRRAEAITFMSQVQQAEERYRANHPSYGDRLIVRSSGFAGVGVAADADAATSFVTPGGYYVITLSDVVANGYVILATGQASQADDSSCKYMQLALVGGNITYNSGSTSGTANGAASSANRRCWNR